MFCFYFICFLLFKWSNDSNIDSAFVYIKFWLKVSLFSLWLVIHVIKKILLIKRLGFLFLTTLCSYIRRHVKKTLFNFFSVLLDIENIKLRKLHILSNLRDFKTFIYFLENIIFFPVLILFRKLFFYFDCIITYRNHFIKNKNFHFPTKTLSKWTIAMIV